VEKRAKKRKRKRGKKKRGKKKRVNVMGKYKVKRGKDGRKGAKLKSRYQCFQGGENIVSEAGGGGRMLA
jgi:hypothetical protein